MTRSKKGPGVVTSEELRARKKNFVPNEQIKTEPIHAGKIIALNRETVRFPDGSTAEMDVVRHPGASAVVPFLTDPDGDDPQVLLIRQFRYASGGYLFEIPAGRLDGDESPEACAIRELKEETGCSAERMEPLTSFLTTPGFTDEVIHLFMATTLTHGQPSREADEFVDVVIMQLAEALDMISSGVITDAKTIIGLLYAAGFRTN